MTPVGALGSIAAGFCCASRICLADSSIFASFALSDLASGGGLRGAGPRLRLAPAGQRCSVRPSTGTGGYMRRWRSQVATSVGAAAIGLVSAVGVVAPPSSNPTPVLRPTPTNTSSSAMRSASDEAPRPYDNFKFISLDNCRDPGAANTVQGGELRGYAVNHFKWCAWRYVALPLRDDQGRVKNMMAYRLTVMAQAREDDRYVTVTHYVDKIHYRRLTGYGPGSKLPPDQPVWRVNRLQLPATLRHGCPHGPGAPESQHRITLTNPTNSVGPLAQSI